MADLPGTLPLSLETEPAAAPAAAFSMSVTRPPTDLHVIITAPDGSTVRWGSEDQDAATIPAGISFRTQKMGGFADSGLNLPRRIDGENTDVRVLDRYELVGADGSVAYDGYVQALPRSLNPEHSLAVQASGWVGHASDEPFTDIIVDRDLGRWGAAATSRKVAVLSAGFGQTADPSTQPDSTGKGSLRTGFTGAWASSRFPICEALYDAGPTNTIGYLYYEWTRGLNVNSADVNYTWSVLLSSTDTLSAIDSSGNLRAAGPAGGTIAATAADRRYGVLQFFNSAASGGADGMEYTIDWTQLAVFGNHGLPNITNGGGTTGGGVAASDVVKYLANQYAPLLRTTATSITPTTYAIPHLTFLSDTTAWEAMLACNAFHLWNLAVWEDQVLHYSPPDLTDYDWEFRTDEYGATMDLQGDSADDLINGVRVQFQNVATGQTEILDPDTYAELRDDSVENSATRARRKIYKGYQITSPTTLDAALQIGRQALAEMNAPKQPGSLTKSFYIRDRAGHPQPVWKVRAGDRIVITSSAAYSDRPRMINETSYSHDGQTVTIGVDAALPRLEGIAHRQQVALAAANLA